MNDGGDGPLGLLSSRFEVDSSQECWIVCLGMQLVEGPVSEADSGIGGVPGEDGGEGEREIGFCPLHCSAALSLVMY